MSFGGLWIEKAWAVGEISEHKDGKRCHVRVLAVGRARDYNETGGLNWIEGACAITRKPISVSCKMILKDRRLHMGMLQNSWIMQAFDFNDIDGERLLQVNEDEDWSQALQREETLKCDCPGWDKARCGFCLHRVQKRTPLEWLRYANSEEKSVCIDAIDAAIDGMSYEQLVQKRDTDKLEKERKDAVAYIEKWGDEKTTSIGDRTISLSERCMDYYGDHDGEVSWEDSCRIVVEQDRQERAEHSATHCSGCGLKIPRGKGYCSKSCEYFAQI